MDASMQYRGKSISTMSPAMRPETPEGRFNLFGDELSPSTRSNPFSSPYTSRPGSSVGSSSGMGGGGPRYFHSRRVRKGEVDQPWRLKVDPKEKWVTIIPVIGLFIGLGIAGFLIYDGISSVVRHNYCSILSDDFSSGLNASIWTKEAEVGGFG
jgi:hypothetical protein